MPVTAPKIMGSMAITRQEQRADQRDLGKNLGNKVRSRLAGTDARDGAVVLTEIIGHLNRIILDGHIEVREQR